MTMSEQQQQKKKTKKSYADLLRECEEVNNKLATVYVKQLCEALRDENPDMPYSEIRDKVFMDCRTIGWGGKTGSTIYHNFPSWLIEDDPNHKKIVKAWETRNANTLSSSADRLMKDVKDIPTPPTPKKKEIDEETDSEMQVLGIAPYGETGKSRRELMGAISENAYKLFAALTNNSTPPISKDDIMVEYILPSKEFRTGLFLEVDKKKRAEIHNILHNVIIAAENTIEIINKVDEE